MLFDFLRQYNNEFTVALRLMLAAAFGGLIGLEREHKHNAAGLRTYMIVCVGAALAMMINQYDYLMINGAWSGLAEEYGIKTDITRIAAQVISGIGFLGAGTIMITGHREVTGLTTAAGLWASACMGIAIGAEFYECVVLAFILIIMAMSVFKVVEDRIVEHSRNMNIYVRLRHPSDIGQLIAEIKSQNIHIYEVELERDSDDLHATSAVLIMRLGEKIPHAQVITSLARLDVVTMIDEI